MLGYTSGNQPRSSYRMVLDMLGAVHLSVPYAVECPNRSSLLATAAALPIRFASENDSRGQATNKARYCTTTVAPSLAVQVGIWAAQATYSLALAQSASAPIVRKRGVLPLLRKNSVYGNGSNRKQNRCTQLQRPPLVSSSRQPQKWS